MTLTSTLVRLVAGVAVVVCTGTAFAQGPAAPADLKTPPADAIKSPSGLVSQQLKAGSDARKATADDVISAHYSVWSAEGKLLDSTKTRNAPARFPLSNVIPGWRECVTLMSVGEERRCWIPQALAYNGQKGRPAGPLVFDIELLSAETSPTVAPPDVAKVPDDARRTATGLAFKVIQPGIGARKPYSTSRVTVHYTGWTVDGKMFDSSVMRGQPATFGLDDVIKGWTEGVQLMVEGEKTRFWIPQALAYAEGGGPKGMLVFDIELLKVN